MKVSAGVGTGRYFVRGGSCEEMVHCGVLNSKFTRQALCNNCFKLLRVKPVQIKTKLFRVNSFVWQVSLLNCTWVIFFIRLPRRSTSKISVTHTVRVAMFKGISMMFKNDIDIGIVNS